MTKRKDHAPKITAAEIAATNFEPLRAEDLEKIRLSYDQRWDSHKATFEIALWMLGQTKDELKRPR
jgi:hypothetical protein